MICFAFSLYIGFLKINILFRAFDIMVKGKYFQFCTREQLKTQVQDAFWF